MRMMNSLRVEPRATMARTAIRLRERPALRNRRQASPIRPSEPPSVPEERKSGKHALPEKLSARPSVRPTRP